MAGIELDAATKQKLTDKLRQYLDSELDVQLGGFDAQFLLDFFIDHIACYYCNQGLADALQAVTTKIEECGELVYELEQSPPTQS